MVWIFIFFITVLSFLREGDLLISSSYLPGINCFLLWQFSFPKPLSLTNTFYAFLTYIDLLDHLLLWFP